MATSKVSAEYAARQAAAQAEYEKLANIANKRLKRLEEAHASGKAHTENILQWGYAEAQSDIKAQRGEGHTRFKWTIPKKSLKEMRKDIAVVKKFTESKSGSLKAWNDTYKKRASKVNEEYGQYGVKVTSDDIAKIYESEAGQYFNNLFGSKTAMKVIGKIQKNAEQIQETIDKARAQHKKININEAIGDVDGFKPGEVVEGLSKSEQKVFNKFAELVARL